VSSNALCLRTHVIFRYHRVSAPDFQRCNQHTDWVDGQWISLEYGRHQLQHELRKRGYQRSYGLDFWSKRFPSSFICLLWFPCTTYIQWLDNG
jgi:hypothetical protein